MNSAFRHPDFPLWVSLVSPPDEFGVIPGTVTPAFGDQSARVLQVSLRLEF